MLVLAMMISTAFCVLRLGLRNWESGVVRASETEELGTAADFSGASSQAARHWWSFDGTVNEFEPGA